MYGYKNIVKPELLVEEPVEQVLTYPTIYNTTIPREMLVEEKLEKLVELEKVEKLWELEEPKYVEKKIIRELLKEELVGEPRFWIKKQLLRELLFNEEVKHVEKKIIKLIFEQEQFITACFPVEKKWLVRELLEKLPTEYVEKKLVREILFNEIYEQKMIREIMPVELVEPRFWEKKIVHEILKEEIEPRFWIKKQLLRELLFNEEVKHIEKKLIKLIVEQEFITGCFPVEKKWLVRELLEKLPTEYVEKKLVREILFNQVVEKKLIREQLFFEQQPELITRQFEKLGMYPTTTGVMEHTVMPVVYTYPIDLTLPLVETELFCHKVEGRHIFPTSGYLHMVWKSLAKLHGIMEIEQLPVIFEKVEFHRPTIMMVRGVPVKKIVEFKVKIVPTTGLFEIVEAEKVIVSGRVKVYQTKRVFETVVPVVQQYLPVVQQQLVGEELLRREEIYTELKQLKGIEVEEELKTLLKTDIKCQYGEMLWTGKWIPFLEGLVQMKQFAKRRTTGFMLPRRIQQLIIDPIMHQEYVEKKMLNKLFQNKYVLPVVYDRRVKKTVVGGIEIVELKGMFVPRIEKIEREILFQQQLPCFLPTMYPTTTLNKVVVPEVMTTLLEQQQPICPITNTTVFGEELPIEMLKLKREYTQYYVEECKRIAEYIVKKTFVPVETTTLLRQPIFFPTPLPVTLKHLIEKIKYERKYWQHPILTAIVQGGEFLQLLKCIVEEIHLIKEESVLRRVQCLLVQNLYKTLEKDVIINMVGQVKPFFFQLFKTILETELVLPHQRFYQPQLPWTTLYEQQPRFLRNTTTLLPEVPRFFDLEQRIKMYEQPRFSTIFRTPSERVFNKYL